MGNVFSYVQRNTKKKEGLQFSPFQTNNLSVPNPFFQLFPLFEILLNGRTKLPLFLFFFFNKETSTNKSIRLVSY